MHGPRAIDIRRTARIISAVENGLSGSDAIVRKAYQAASRMSVIGVTGPPGAGKSTLVDRLAAHWADAGEQVAILAVDPSSPFTGGAVLGDRVRMEHAGAHPRVYLRSLSSRGHLGGMGSTTLDIAMVLGDLGFDRVVLETVGAGQSDVAVGMAADAVLVVAVPGLGDQVQASKAGILEIGDVYVVNKSDVPGAGSAAGYLEGNLDLLYPGKPGPNGMLAPGRHQNGNEAQHRRHGEPADAQGFWRPPVLLSSARLGNGITELAAAMEGFLDWSRATGHHAQRLLERFSEQVLRRTESRLMQLCLAAAAERGLGVAELATEIARGSISPGDASERLVRAGASHILTLGPDRRMATPPVAHHGSS